MQCECSRIAAAVQNHGILHVWLDSVAVLTLVAVEAALLSGPGNHGIVDSAFTQPDFLKLLGRDKTLCVAVVLGHLVKLLYGAESRIGVQDNHVRMKQVVKSPDNDVSLFPGYSGADYDPDYPAVHIGGHTRNHVGFTVDDSECRGLCLPVLEEISSPQNRGSDCIRPPVVIGIFRLVPGKEPQLDMAVHIINTPCDETALEGDYPVYPRLEGGCRLFDCA